MRRLIIITHNYAPMISPRAFRWAALANALAGLGHEVHVISSLYPEQPPTQRINGVTVWRVGGILEKFRTRFAGGPAAGHAVDAAVKSGRSLLKLLHEHTWKRVYWPDYACLWLAAAQEKASELARGNEPVTLISVSDPYSGHLAGLGVVTRTPRLRWVADIGDPFSFAVSHAQNNVALYAQRNLRLERAVLARADAVSVTTEPTRAALALLVPTAIEKIRVIPPLFTEESTRATTPVSVDGSRTRAVVMVCVGTLYRQMRNPSWLLQLFEQALVFADSPPAELHVVGDTNDCGDILTEFKARLGETLRLYGLVSRNTAQMMIARADVLINLGNNSPYQLPSKVVEYAASGKPIVHVAAHPDDCCLEFFRDYPAAVIFRVLGPPTPADTHRLRELLSNPRKHLTKPQIERFLAPYRLEAVVAQYRELIEG